jgi:hypothetical protein
VVVHILFAEQAMLTDSETVIGGEKDIGVVGHARLFEHSQSRINNASDFCIT